MSHQLVSFGEVAVLSLVMLVGWFACLAPRRAYDWLAWFGTAHPWSKPVQGVDRRLTLEQRVWGLLMAIFSGAMIANEVAGMLLRGALGPEAASESLRLVGEYFGWHDIAVGVAMILAGAYLILRPQDLVRPKFVKSPILEDVGRSISLAITLRMIGFALLLIGSFELSLGLKTRMV